MTKIGDQRAHHLDLSSSQNLRQMRNPSPNNYSSFFHPSPKAEVITITFRPSFFTAAAAADADADADAITTLK